MNKNIIKNIYIFLIIISIGIIISSCKNSVSKNESIMNESTSIEKEISVVDTDISDIVRDAKITLIGDSIAEGAKSSLIHRFKNMHIDSLAGREIETAYDVFSRLLNYGKIGDIVIVSLGTNAKDVIRTDKLEMIYEKLNGKPMFLLSIVMPYKGQERNRNRDIKKFVKTHNNCYLIDYYKAMKNHPEYFNEDGVHPNGIGSEVYAQIIFDAITRFLK